MKKPPPSYNIKTIHLLPMLLLCLLTVLPTAASAALQDTSKTDGSNVIQEPESERMWTMDRSKKFRSPTQVEEYLSRLNKGEYSDWRLPTKWELYDLFQLFALKKIPPVKTKLEMSYWLAGENGKMRVGSWDAGDGCGIERKFYPGKKGYVRAVRP
ncbi:MAG: hypothetical protein JRC87_07040 [Deltaproteobacteria bacterium]|nr:hypothetical protein [Deltaproteobacteria bacterium]MBW2659331.1 hypothetical protein [Deltaproteobacteria bacterium]